VRHIARASVRPIPARHSPWNSSASVLVWARKYYLTMVSAVVFFSFLCVHLSHLWAAHRLIAAGVPKAPRLLRSEDKKGMVITASLPFQFPDWLRSSWMEFNWSSVFLSTPSTRNLFRHKTSNARILATKTSQRETRWVVAQNLKCLHRPEKEVKGISIVKGCGTFHVCSISFRFTAERLRAQTVRTLFHPHHYSPG